MLTLLKDVTHKILFATMSIRQNNNPSVKERWYDNLTLLDVLIFILPPIGIYGVIRTKKIHSKLMKFLLCSLGILSMSVTIISFLKHV